MTDAQHGQLPALNPPDPAVSIRYLGRDDVTKLHAGCYAERQLWWVETLVERALQIAGQGRGFGIVIPTSDETVIRGYGQLTLWPRSAEISDLMVMPSERGHGLGTAMIQYLVQAAWQTRTSRVEIGVAQHNHRARALYQRLGFEHRYSMSARLDNGDEMVDYLGLTLPDR